ncbi:MAG: YIP1 family protein, partial [Acutalibacteraceae bacterium]|nr:YIP1 family protein [Acutalibacteraceae bacterium]
VLLWTVVNWGLTTLFQGKGNMKQVYIVTCYALIPQIIYNVLITLLTNVLTPEEALVIEAIYVVCRALTLIMLCVGTMTIHEFGFFKFIVMTVVIIFGMLICVFVIMMIFVLIQQLFTFIGTIYKEISYR